MGYSSTNFSAMTFARSMERSGVRRISKFSNSQCAYRCGIFAVVSRRSDLEPFIHSQRATPSTPSRETRAQPVSPQIEHMPEFYMGEGTQEAQKAQDLKPIVLLVFRFLN